MRSLVSRGATLVAAAVLGAAVAGAAPAQAQSLVTSTSFGSADWDRDGHQDLVVRDDRNGDLYLFPGRSVRGPAGSPVKIGNGWNGWEPVGIADYDRDGHQDIVTRNLTTREIWLYPGQSVRGYSYAVPVRMYGGQQAAELSRLQPIGVGDWDRDGRPDLMMYEPVPGGPYSGCMIYQIVGTGSRAPQTGYVRAQAGMLAQGHTPYGLTDWDRSGTLDTLFRWTNGDLKLLPGPGQRNVWSTGSVQIGNGWNGWTLFGTSDWDRDGHQDIIVRNDSTRDLWLYPGASVRGYSPFPPVRIGSGW